MYSCALRSTISLPVISQKAEETETKLNLRPDGWKVTRLLKGGGGGGGGLIADISRETRLIGDGECSSENFLCPSVKY